MKKKILSLLLVCSTLSTYAQTSTDATFPYSISMTGNGNGTNSPAGIKTFVGSSDGFPIFNSRGTILTNDTTQFSAIYLEDLAFTTQEGFIIDFTYSLYGGSMVNGKYADGFALILFNGAITSPTVGANGSALGYAFNAQPYFYKYGLSSAYLGIGFDSFGGFKNVFSNGTDYRNGIRPASTHAALGDDVTIRGPYNPSGNLFLSGYPVLISQYVGDDNTLTFNRSTLNPTNGTYTTSNVDLPKFGGLRGGIYTNDVTNDAYRKASVSMIPGVNANNDKGFYLSVTIYHGLTDVQVIKDYFVNTTNPIIKYIENNQESKALTDLSLAPPTSLKLGFSASTGAGSQTVEIRDVSVTLPFSPSIGDIRIMNVCATDGQPSRFNILTNSGGYANNVYNTTNPPLPSFGNLDLTSFRFKTLNADGSFSVTSDPYVYISTQGKYTYNPATGNITFQPDATLASRYRTEDIYFDIKNKKPSSGADISTENYRSRTGKATIAFTTTQCTPITPETPTATYKYIKING